MIVKSRAIDNEIPAPKAPNWGDWIATEEGKRCGNFLTLQGLSDKDADRFLDNRLWAAYAAGAAYGRQNP